MNQNDNKGSFLKWFKEACEEHGVWAMIVSMLIVIPFFLYGKKLGWW